MPKRHDCQARQYGDQMICAACGLDAAIAHAKARQGLPHELPADVAVEMVKTYQANARDGIKGQIAGMQAAYRLFLDRVEL